MVMLMFAFSPEELLLCCGSVFLLILIAVIVYVIYIYLNKGRNEHIKSLESRIEKLEKEKNMNEYSDDLQKK